MPTSQLGKSTLYFSDLFQLVSIVIHRYTADMYIYCTKDVKYQIRSQLTRSAARIRYLA